VLQSTDPFQPRIADARPIGVEQGKRLEALEAHARHASAAHPEFAQFLQTAQPFDAAVANFRPRQIERGQLLAVCEVSNASVGDLGTQQLQNAEFSAGAKSAQGPIATAGPLQVERIESMELPDQLKVCIVELTVGKIQELQFLNVRNLRQQPGIELLAGDAQAVQSAKPLRALAASPLRPELGRRGGIGPPEFTHAAKQRGALPERQAPGKTTTAHDQSHGEQRQVARTLEPFGKSDLTGHGDGWRGSCPAGRLWITSRSSRRHRPSYAMSRASDNRAYLEARRSSDCRAKLPRRRSR
jgi:hypothetical protein